MNQISIQSKKFALLVVAAIALAACGGSSENSSSASSAVTRTKNNALPTEATTTVVESCATGGACAVGDTGPGGGKVFYVASSSFTSEGSACGTACMYLEAAPTGWIVAATPAYQTNCEVLGNQSSDPMCTWSANTISFIGTTGTGIGAGYANTSKMINQNSGKGKAGTVARAFKGGGKTDWHLPSKDEAYEMYLQKDMTGTFWNGTDGNGYYWTSSEQDKSLAWLNRSKYYSKTTKQYVRPVRAFSGTTALGLAAVVTTSTTTTVASTTTAVESCAKGGVCAVGDTGPGGGKVFYVASSSFTSTGSACGTACMYLEAAPTGWFKSTGQSGCNENYPGSSTVDPACYWAICTNCLVGTTGTGIGKGYANTSAVIANSSSTYGAAGATSMARAFKGGGKTDWHLPSKDELNQMYLNKTTIGGLDLFEDFGTKSLNVAHYWSSSEDGNGKAWKQFFSDGSQSGSDKSTQPFVRPVRAFSGTTALGLAAVVTTTTSTTTSTTIAPVVASCATGGACAVGDTGPGGGKVFYVSASGFTSTGSACGTKCNYLEAAPTGWITAATPAGQKNCTTLGTSTLDPKCEWSGNTTVAIAPVGKLIGTGYANTSAMIAQSGTTGKAGTVARAFQGGGKTDWYLPSRDELYEMSLNMAIIGVDSGKYWSSTQAVNSASASLRSFNLGYELDGFKTTANYVRPVRAFASSQCLQGGACAVGDTGPGGGNVFYVAPTSFTSTGSACGTKCMYLEVAPTGWITAATPAGQKNCTTLGTSTLDPKCEWSGNTSNLIGTTGTGIGTGYANTSAMITQSGTTGKAGTVARAFKGGGKTDWFLPSEDELNQMYLNKGISGIDSGRYWSSTERKSQAFDDGSPGRSDKTNTYYVRPVRAF